MLVYVDGSALSRYMSGVPGLPEAAAWQEWADEHRGDLVTTPLSVTELRRVADLLGPEARERARQVELEMPQVRFSDQTLKVAAIAASVLGPFAALHVGAAVAHPQVGAIATYDPLVARVSALYKLSVISPGRPIHWWLG
jgi:predicted nucleic acid-binding protein